MTNLHLLHWIIVLVVIGMIFALGRRR